MSPTHNLLKIALVEDHPIVVEGLQKVLKQSFPDADVIDFSSGDAFLSFSGSFTVVILDITMPGKNGVEICKEVKAKNPQSCVLAFSNHAERSIIMQMLQNGANGYFLKNASGAEITKGIKDALLGHIVFGKEIMEIISRPSPDELKAIPSLTKREKEILKLIGEGKTSSEIGEKLFVSPFTIETHRRNLMQKFNVKNVASLIKLATQHGFL